MNYEEIKNEHNTPNIIGVCVRCENKILSNQLFVDLEKLYHFSCHNLKMKEEQESKFEQ